MSEETGAPAGGEAFTVTELPADAPETFNSASEAAAYFTSLKAPKKEPPAERAEAATAEPELAQANADPAEEQPISEDTNEAEPAELPPIDPPRSWTQAEKERFQSLPRETQEYLHTREQEREREFRRSQNEIAEERKAAKAERETAEKTRQQYEAQLPALMQELQNAQQSSFADVRTVDDVTKLANEDPFRYLQWQAHQTKLQAVNAELERSKGEKSKAEQSAWQSHVQKENELAAEYIPELADKTKGPALTARAADRLSELGFKPEELARLASGQERLSLYDHRIQRLIFSDLKLADIQSAPKAVVKPNLPPVQRPGNSKPPGSVQSERVQALNRKSELTVKEATELYELQSRSTRRAS